MNKSKIVSIFFSLSFFLCIPLAAADSSGKPNFKLKNELSYPIYYYISSKPNEKMDDKRFIVEDLSRHDVFRLEPGRETSAKIDEKYFPFYLLLSDLTNGYPPKPNFPVKVFKLDPKKNKKIFITIKTEKNQTKIVPQRGAFGILRISDNIENREISDLGLTHYRFQKR